AASHFSQKCNVAIPALVPASHTAHDYSTGECPPRFSAERAGPIGRELSKNVGAAAPGRVAYLEKIDGPPFSILSSASRLGRARRLGRLRWLGALRVRPLPRALPRAVDRISRSWAARSMATAPTV